MGAGLGQGMLLGLRQARGGGFIEAAGVFEARAQDEAEERGRDLIVLDVGRPGVLRDGASRHPGGEGGVAVRALGFEPPRRPADQIADAQAGQGVGERAALHGPGGEAGEAKDPSRKCVNHLEPGARGDVRSSLNAKRPGVVSKASETPFCSWLLTWLFKRRPTFSPLRSFTPPRRGPSDAHEGLEEASDPVSGQGPSAAIRQTHSPPRVTVGV